MTYPERIIPDETPPGVVALHLKRYTFASSWCADADVLDIGCGVGYGCAALAEVARHVIGGDVAEETLAYARRRYKRPNVEFVRLDATALPFDDSTFDTVVSFETIEHLDHPEALVRGAARVLRPNGAFLVSTPRSPTTTHSPDNPFHRVEFASTDFTRLLEESFAVVDLLGERRLQTRLHRTLQRLDVLGIRRRSALLRRASIVTGTPATEHLTADDLVISPKHIERAEVLYAVCRLPRR